jgi:hypothetical protein
VTHQQAVSRAIKSSGPRDRREGASTGDSGGAAGGPVTD